MLNRLKEKVRRGTNRKKELKQYEGMATAQSGVRQGLLSGRKSVSPPARTVADHDPKSIATHGVVTSLQSPTPIKEKKSSFFNRKGSKKGKAPASVEPAPNSKKRLTYGSKVQKGLEHNTKQLGGQSFKTVTVAIHTPNAYRTYLKHILEPDDNFVRLSLKYHVEVDDIKRANNLYQNDSIHIKTELLIPTNDQNMDFANEQVTIGDIKREESQAAAAAARDPSPEMLEEVAPELAATEIGRPIKAASDAFFAKFDANYKQVKTDAVEAIISTAEAGTGPGTASSLYAPDRQQRQAAREKAATDSRIGSGLRDDTSAVSYQNS